MNLYLQILMNHEQKKVKTQARNQRKVPVSATHTRDGRSISDTVLLNSSKPHLLRVHLKDLKSRLFQRCETEKGQQTTSELNERFGIHKISQVYIRFPLHQSKFKVNVFQHGGVFLPLGNSCNHAQVSSSS